MDKNDNEHNEAADFLLSNQDMNIPITSKLNDPKNLKRKLLSDEILDIFQIYY